MRAQCRWLFASVFALVVPGAWAAGGRIVFTGAVVEPTCSVESTPIEPNGAQLWQAGQTSIRRSCGQAAGRSYSRTVVALDAANAADDRLLAYFVSYTPPQVDGDTTAKLVVRTYD